MQMILQWKWEWTECEAAVSYWHLGNPLGTKWAESKHAVLTIYSQTNSMDLCFCRYQETLLFAEHHLLQFVCLPQSVSHHLQQWVLALLSSGAASLPQPVPQHTDFFFLCLSLQSLMQKILTLASSLCTTATVWIMWQMTWQVGTQEVGNCMCLSWIISFGAEGWILHTSSLWLPPPHWGQQP